MLNLVNTLDAGRQCHAQGDVPKAELHYRQVLRVDPHNAEAAFLVAVACKDQGKLMGTVAHLQKALGIRPRYVEALNAGAHKGRQRRCDRSSG